MSSTIAEMRNGIAANLANIAGLRTTTTTPDVINPPVAIVQPQTVDYDETFQRGMATYTFVVTVIVGRAAERTAQTNLDLFVAQSGSKSVKAAIESDKTLGGKVFDCRVTTLRSYGSTTINDVLYLAGEFTVLVYAS
jgi:hypothetical protein